MSRSLTLVRSGFALTTRRLAVRHTHDQRLPLPPTLPYDPQSAPVRRHLAILQETLAADSRRSWAIFAALDSSLHQVVPIDALEVLLRQQIEKGQLDRVETLLKAASASKGCLSRDVLRKVAEKAHDRDGLVEVLWSCATAGSRIDRIPLEVRQAYLACARGDDEMLRRASESAPFGVQGLGEALEEEHLTADALPRLAKLGIVPREDVIRAIVGRTVRSYATSLEESRHELGQLVRHVPGAAQALGDITGGSHEIAALLGARIAKGPLDTSRVVTCLQDLLNGAMLPRNATYVDAQYRTIKTIVKVLGRTATTSPAPLLNDVFQAIDTLSPADELEKAAIRDVTIKAIRLLQKVNREDRAEIVGRLVRSGDGEVTCCVLDVCEASDPQAQAAALELIGEPKHAARAMRFLAEQAAVERDVARRLNRANEATPRAVADDERLTSLLLRCLPHLDPTPIRAISPALLGRKEAILTVVTIAHLCSDLPAVAYHWSLKLRHRDDIHTCAESLAARGDAPSRILAHDLYHRMQSL